MHLEAKKIAPRFPTKCNRTQIKDVKLYLKQKTMKLAL